MVTIDQLTFDIYYVTVMLQRNHYESQKINLETESCRDRTQHGQGQEVLVKAVEEKSQGQTHRSGQVTQYFDV
jgi:hypothetical protein